MNQHGRPSVGQKNCLVARSHSVCIHGDLWNMHIAGAILHAILQSNLARVPPTYLQRHPTTASSKMSCLVITLRGNAHPNVHHGFMSVFGPKWMKWLSVGIATLSYESLRLCHGPTKGSPAALRPHHPCACHLKGGCRTPKSAEMSRS